MLTHYVVVSDIGALCSTLIISLQLYQSAWVKIACVSSVWKKKNWIRNVEHFVVSSHWRVISFRCRRLNRIVRPNPVSCEGTIALADINAHQLSAMEKMMWKISDVKKLFYWFNVAAVCVLCELLRIARAPADLDFLFRFFCCFFRLWDVCECTRALLYLLFLSLLCLGSPALAYKSEFMCADEFYSWSVRAALRRVIERHFPPN